MEREVIGSRVSGPGRSMRTASPGSTFADDSYAWSREVDVTSPATEVAARWQGWGTALKPAFEPIVVARKPLVGTVAANVLAHGTGALNIDGCRIDANGERFGGGAKGSSGFVDGYESGAGFVTSTAGRWPTNVLLDGSQADALDEQSGTMRDGTAVKRNADGGQKKSGGYGNPPVEDVTYGDTGGASRFFPAFRYQAKAAKKERPKVGDVAHPTVKPLALMRWLVRLVCPPGGVVLDPFAGSGSTAEACVLEGFGCVAIEREPDYLPLIELRMSRVGVTATVRKWGIEGKIEQATSYEELTAIYAEHWQEWTDELTELAAKRRKEVEAA